MPWQAILWCMLVKIDTPSSFCVLAFNSRWEYSNADYCVNIDDDSSMSDKNFANFGTVTPDIWWLICVGDECTSAKIHCAVVSKCHSLDDSTLARLWVRNAVVFAHTGHATCWALPHFLIFSYNWCLLASFCCILQTSPTNVDVAYSQNDRHRYGSR